MPSSRFLILANEEREKAATALLRDYLPGWLARTEARLQVRGGQWFSGGGLTHADIVVMVHLSWLMAPEEWGFRGMDNVEERAGLLDNFPLLKDHYNRVRAVPEIADWIKKRGECEVFVDGLSLEDKNNQDPLVRCQCLGICSNVCTTIQLIFHLRTGRERP